MIKRCAWILAAIVLMVQPTVALDRPTGGPGHYECFSLLGGIFGSLDSLLIAGGGNSGTQKYALKDGDTASVGVLTLTSAAKREYIFDADGTDATDSVTYTVIRPLDYSTAGVWRLVVFPIEMMPSDMATDTEVSAEIVDAIYDHGVAADPHAGYMLESNIGTGASNYVQLDGSARLPAVDGSQLTNLPAGTGDISGVLGDSSGEVPFLYQSWTAFGAGDATPDVSTAQQFRTVDTTTITGFDHGGSAITDGRTLTVYCGAATVFDLTSSEITAANRNSDFTCSAGTVLSFAYNTDQWYALNIPDAYSTLSSSGVVVNNAGAPQAVTITGGDGVTITNGDGIAGNPTISAVAYPFREPGTILTPADADDAPWFRAGSALTLTSFGCIASGSTPSITVDLQECDSAGANCATVIDGAITCNGGWDAGTLTDTAVASGAIMRINLGAPSGTVDSIMFTLEGTQ